MNFRVGEPVVCVDDSPTKNGYAVQIVKGGIYTITGLDTRPGELAIFLAGIKKAGPLSGAYYVSRFRPLVTRKTSIEIFERMLTPDLEKVRA